MGCKEEKKKVLNERPRSLSRSIPAVKKGLDPLKENLFNDHVRIRRIFMDGMRGGVPCAHSPFGRRDCVVAYRGSTLLLGLSYLLRIPFAKFHFLQSRWRSSEGRWSLGWKRRNRLGITTALLWFR